MSQRNRYLITRPALASYVNQRVTATATLQRHGSRLTRHGRIGTLCLEFVCVDESYVADHVWVDAPEGSHALRVGTVLHFEATVGEYGRPGRRDYALKDVAILGNFA